MGRSEAPPQGLPAYLEPLRCLGEGGMGSVWSVRDNRTGHVGALKAIRSGLLTEQAIVRRFEREMRTCAQLNHPYIVQVLDVGRLETGAPYMLMEQIDGVPLIDLDLRGRTAGELIRLFDRILSALGYAHARRIIHRDLKPDNVLVYTDELGELIPKLMDFGLAMVAVKGQLATRLTADGMVVGTPAYMAPEQACDEHHKICPATDLYAYGCMLYELLCGSPPHIAASPMALLLAHATKPPRPFVPLPTIGGADALEPLIMRLLAKDPEERFELAADVRQELRLSGLLDAEHDVDAEPIGHYGDTLVAMPALTPSTVAAAVAAEAGDIDAGALLEARVRRGESPIEPIEALERPPEADFQVSVLNLREPTLVGRVEARNTLQRYVEDVRDAGQAAVCLISGPNGIGKTRLVRWLAEDGETRGALRYLRVSLAAGSSAGLSVLLAVVNHLRLKGLSPSQCEQALLRFFRTDDPEDWRVTGFRTLVEQRDGLSSSSGSSMNSTMSRLDLLLHAALERLAEGRPLVLWLDDASTMPAPAVRKLVAGIAVRQKSRPSPILMVVVDRADLDMPSDLELAIGNLEQVWLRTGVHLEPLSPHEMLELTTEGLRLSPHLARHVARLSDGLPLLAVALARQWHAGGLLESTPQGFVSRIELGRLPVPEAVQTVLLNQLELAFTGLGRALWEPVARAAAVIGRTFTEKWLAAALEALPVRVAPVSAQRFVELALVDGVVRPSDDGTSYEYASGLMREGVLANVPAERMADLHRAVARAKAADAGRRPGLHLEVARHLLAGRAFVEAYEAYVRAARDAFRHGRLDEARQHLDAAQEALAQQDGVSGPWDERVVAVWELELEIELSDGAIDRAAERLAWIEHATSRFDDAQWRARAGRAQALLARHRDRDEAAVRRLLVAALGELDRALDVADTRRDDGHDHQGLRASILVELAGLDGVEDIVVTRAVTSARHSGQPELLARALLAHGRLALREGAHARARDRLTEGLAAATDVGDVRTEAALLESLSELSTTIGDHEQAEKLLYSASRCYEALGELDTVAACHRKLADLARDLGREHDARNHERWLELIGG